MLKWIKKIFMNEIKPTGTSAAEVDTSQPQVIEREFELAIYDVTINDATGKEEIRPVSYGQPITVKAKTREELETTLKMYEMTGQKVKVIREIGSHPVSIPQAPVPQVSQASVPQMPNLQLDASKPQPSIVTASAPIIVTQTKPRFFKIGDVDVKDDNGKIFQKQWMKLTDSEASNIRIVNDKNNQLVNLVGKHIEMKRWVMIENSNSSTDELEENL